MLVMNIMKKKIKAVQAVLTEIDATDIPQVIVFNKIDTISTDARSQIPAHIDVGNNTYPTVQLSALEQDGLEPLLKAIASRLSQLWYHGWLRINAAEASYIRSELYQLESIEEEKTTATGDLLLHVHMPASGLKKYATAEPIDAASASLAGI